MRLVRRLGLSVCLLLTGGAVTSAQQPPSQVLRLTEAEALERMMSSDPRMRGLGARIDEVRAVQAERLLWPNPVVTYSREHVANTDDVFVVARQELPITGRMSRIETAGRFAVDAAEADIRFQRVRLQAELRQVFTTLLLAQEREAVLLDGIKALQDLIAMLRAREDAGEGSSYDRMRGERALAELRAELVSAQVARAQAQGELAGYLGPNVLPQTLGAAGQLEHSGPAPLLASLVEQAIAARADHRVYELLVQQFEAERLAAARLRVPTPAVSGGLKRSGSNDVRSEGYQFSLDLTVPLFNRGQSAEALAAAQATRAAADAAWSRVRIEADVRAAHAALVMQQEEAARYRQSAADTAEPLVQIGRVGYEEGELGILELLDAETQVLRARLRLLELTAAARRTAIDLDRATGQEIRR